MPGMNSAGARGRTTIRARAVAVVVACMLTVWAPDPGYADLRNLPPGLKILYYGGSDVILPGESPDTEGDPASSEAEEQWPMGGAAYALAFDGRDDWVEVDGNPLPDFTDVNQLTLEAWVYRRPTGDYWQCAVSKGNDQPFGLTVSKDRFLHFELATSEDRKQLNTPKGSVPYRTWTHIAGVWDGKTMRSYINGVEKASEELGGTIKTTDQRFIIGAGGRGGFEGWNGVIDEVRVWNVARTMAEINIDMHRSLSGTEPGLVGYWDFDEGKGQACRDRGGNGSALRLGSEPDTDDGDPAWVVSGAPLGMGKWALEFDGIDDYVEVEEELGLEMADSFTIEGWVQFDEGGPESQCVVSLGSATAECGLVASSTDSGTVLGFVLRGEDGESLFIRSNTILGSGRWHFVAATWDGSTLRTFVNAREDIVQDITDWVAPWEGHLRIGSNMVDGLEYFKGRIDDLSVWSRALPASRIRDGMYRGISVNEYGLLAYWDFDKSGGQVCHDRSPNHNHGQLGSSPEEDENDPRWVCIVCPQGGGQPPAVEEVSQPKRYGVRGRVTDDREQPLNEVLIRSIYAYVITMTEESGHFEWSTSSSETQSVCFMKDGFITRQMTLTPGAEKEITVKLNRELRVRGSVTDAVTGEPVPEFTVVPGIVSSDPAVDGWDDQNQFTFTVGRYSISFGRPLHFRVTGEPSHPVIHDLASDTGHSHQFRVEADGYQAVVSDEFKDYGAFDESVEFNVVLYPLP